jgi:ribose transport system permease protein
MISNKPSPDSKASAAKAGQTPRFGSVGTTVGRVLSNQTMFMLIILLAMLLAFSQLSPHFFSKDNLLQITIQAAVICMLGAGQTFVILTSGIDLGVGSVLALVTVMSAIVMEAWPAFVKSTGFLAGLRGAGLVPGLLAGLAVGALCGLANGVFIGKLRIPPFVSTLGMMGIARGFALIFTNGIPRFRLAPGGDFLGQGHVWGIPVPTISVFVLFVICYVILTRTKLGRYTYAIGSNPQATLLSGINVSGYLVMIYTISGVTAAMAGLTEMSRIGSGQPAGGQGYELDSIAAVVLGGTSLLGGEGKILGTLIGALIIAILRNGLNILNIYAFWQQVAIGFIIILAVFADQVRRGNKN